MTDSVRNRRALDHTAQQSTKSLRTIIEESKEMQSNLIINFINFQKAFDSTHRISLWDLLKLYGFPIKYINIIKAFYADSKCCVKTDTGISEWFTV
jgi:hypothetical protein